MVSACLKLGGRANHATFSTQMGILSGRAIGTVPMVCPAASISGQFSGIAWLATRTIGLVEFALVLADWAICTGTLPVGALEPSRKAGAAERLPGVGLVLADRARFAPLLADFILVLTNASINTRAGFDKSPRVALNAFCFQKWEYY